MKHILQTISTSKKTKELDGISLVDDHIGVFCLPYRSPRNLHKVDDWESTFFKKYGARTEGLNFFSAGSPLAFFRIPL